MCLAVIRQSLAIRKANKRKAASDKKAAEDAARNEEAESERMKQLLAWCDGSEWDKEVHLNPEQIQRRLLSEEFSDLECQYDGDDCEVVSIRDKKGNTYRATENTCTCEYFKKHELPCEHIYWYLNDQGYLDDWPQDQFDEEIPSLPTEMKNQIHGMVLHGFLSGTVSAQKYATICKALGVN